jgi:hypothetical protein
MTCGRFFSGSPISSTSKTDHHDITEILLKWALNTITLTLKDYQVHIRWAPSKIFFVAFFSVTVEGRNLIFGHKLHIGTPYSGKRFWSHQIPTSCLPTLLIFIHIEHTFCICPFLAAFFSATIDELVTKYQISAINSCWEKCDEKCAYMFNVYTSN